MFVRAIIICVAMACTTGCTASHVSLSKVGSPEEPGARKVMDEALVACVDRHSINVGASHTRLRPGTDVYAIHLPPLLGGGSVGDELTFRALPGRLVILDVGPQLPFGTLRGWGLLVGALCAPIEPEAALMGAWVRGDVRGGREMALAFLTAEACAKTPGFSCPVDHRHRLMEMARAIKTRAPHAAPVKVRAWRCGNEAVARATTTRDPDREALEWLVGALARSTSTLSPNEVLTWAERLERHGLTGGIGVALYAFESQEDEAAPLHQATLARLTAERYPKAIQAPRLLWNASVFYRRAGRAQSANEMLRALVRLYPDDRLTPDAWRLLEPPSN